ncbi:MAG: hypothetical protein WCS03_18765, partial [Bacteroidota bacterium]
YLKAGKRETKKQETYFGLPVLTTKPITDITYITSTCGGNIGDDGHLPITLKGVCWGISQNPTLNDFKTNDGNGTGSYVSNLTGLISNTTYYVRAFATNTIGTGYGDQISFTTLIIPPTTIWSSDFSNTYDWSFSYFTGFNSGAYWIITTNNPQGARSSQMGRINSTTWSNKFALFDSNYMGANLNQNNQYSCIQTENSINCTQYSHITIEFQQYYKKYSDTTMVIVSSDGGLSWNEGTYFPLLNTNTNLFNNQSTLNPDYETIDISSFAGNLPNVFIGFAFKSSIHGGGNAWMVDDVKVIGSNTKNKNAREINWGRANFYRPKVLIKMNLN